MIPMADFPKLECPFIRKNFKVNKKDWQKYGRELQLRTPEVYLVQDQINPGYEWVFDDAHTIAVEKLDGTNVKVSTSNGKLVAIQNRKNIIDPLDIMKKGHSRIIEGVFLAIQKGYLERDGEQAGEVIGPDLQGNPYKLSNHIWYPFEKTLTALQYKSFHEHERTLDMWSSWFKDYLRSRFYIKTHDSPFSESIFAEGVIFYNLKRKEENKSWRAKLRRDMFPWYYSDKIEIYGDTE